MIITPHRHAHHHSVEQIKFVDVYIHENPSSCQNHCYGEVVATTNVYNVYDRFGRISFEGSSTKNLGNIVLNGHGTSKARAKTSRLLKSLIVLIDR